MCALNRNAWWRGHAALSVPLICVAWLFPFALGPSPLWMSQIVVVGSLSFACLLIGPSVLPGLANLAFVAACGVIVGGRGTYAVEALWGVLALLGCWCAAGAGARARQESAVATIWMLGLLGAAVGNAVEGLLQYFGLAGGFWPWVVDPLQRGLAYGAMRQPNLLATLLCSGVVAAVYLSERRKLTASMGWLLIGVLQACLVATGSRIGVVEVVSLGLMALVWRRQASPLMLRMLWGQALLFILWSAVLPWLAHLHGFEALRSTASRFGGSGSDGRWAMWSNTLELIAQRPWTGWGWRELGYANYVGGYTVRAEGLVDHAHNLPLQLAVELGIPVAVLFCTFVAWSLWRAAPWRSRLPEQQVAWLVLLVIGLHSLVELPLWSGGFVFLAGFALGQLLPPAGFQLSQAGSVLRLTFYAIGGILVLTSLGAWTQYSRVSRVYEVSSRLHPEESRKAIQQASSAWMLEGHLSFAALRETTVTSENAAQVLGVTERLLHFSAEPRVIEALLASLALLGDTERYRQQVQLYCRVFPKNFDRWRGSLPPESMNTTTSCPFP